LIPSKGCAALSDVERHAARRTHQLIRERSILPPQATHERPQRFDQLQTQPCNLKTHVCLSGACPKQAPATPPQARAGEVEAAPQGHRRSRREAASTPPSTLAQSRSQQQQTIH
jgi:hypothetical protein